MARSKALKKEGGFAVEARGGVDAQRKVAGLENILSHIAAPMFIVDKDLVVARMNEAACRATGYRAEEVVGKMTCAELTETPLCGTKDCMIRKSMRTGETIIGETVRRMRGGRKVPIVAVCSALPDEDGKPNGGMEVIIDRTGR